VESRVSQIHSSAVVRLRAALAGLRTGHAADGQAAPAKMKQAGGRMMA
jgi:hypothetical protein